MKNSLSKNLKERAFIMDSNLQWCDQCNIITPRPVELQNHAKQGNYLTHIFARRYYCTILMQALLWQSPKLILS
jgi:hypothetical protein